MPEARPGRVGVHRAGGAREPDRALDEHPQQAGQHQQPGQRVQSRTTCWSWCHAGRVAGHAADHEPHERPPDQARERQHQRVAGVVEDPGQEVGQRLVVRAAAVAGRHGDEQPADPDPDHGVHDELHGGALDQPDHEKQQGRGHAHPQRHLELARGEPESGEQSHGRHGGLDRCRGGRRGPSASWARSTCLDGLDRGPRFAGRSQGSSLTACSS